MDCGYSLETPRRERVPTSLKLCIFHGQVFVMILNAFHSSSVDDLDLKVNIFYFVDIQRERQKRGVIGKYLHFS